MTDIDTRSIAYEAVGAALQHARASYERQGGGLPPIGSLAWQRAPWQVHVATLAAAGLAALLDDRVQHGALKQAAVGISLGLDWRAESSVPSHAELERRRAE